MGKPTPQKARQRKALIEAKLRNWTPIHRMSLWDLYQSPKGYYIVRYRQSAEQTVYVAVTKDGGVHDMLGYPVDNGDVTIAFEALKAANLGELAEKVIGWSRRPRQ